MLEISGLESNFYVAKTEAPISSVITAQLIRVFVFAHICKKKHLRHDIWGFSITITFVVATFHRKKQHKKKTCYIFVLFYNPSLQLN